MGWPRADPRAMGQERQLSLCGRILGLSGVSRWPTSRVSDKCVWKCALAPVQECACTQQGRQSQACWPEGGGTGWEIGRVVSERFRKQVSLFSAEMRFQQLRLALSCTVEHGGSRGRRSISHHAISQGLLCPKLCVHFNGEKQVINYPGEKMMFPE